MTPLILILVGLALVGAGLICGWRAVDRRAVALIVGGVVVNCLALGMVVLR